MPDWSSTMTQTFEYYIVDPYTWTDVKRIENVKSCSITRDYETDTFGSSTIDVIDLLGESYVRVYLVTIQNGITEKHPLATFLVQTPSSTYDGKSRSVTMDAYTPLLELKENPPPLGYSILKGENILDKAYKIMREQMRAPIVKTDSTEKLKGDFVASVDDSWITFIKDFIYNAKYELALDEMGRVLYSPIQETESLQPVTTFDDGNSSILYPETTIDHDLYGIPNVVEVIYSGEDDVYYSRVVNDDPNSPISTVNRGREIIHRDSSPNIIGNPTQRQIDEYAEKLLKTLSSVEYTITYTHGYYPVRLGDCVRLNYESAGLVDIKARVISQTIKCESGCPVTEKAIFTKKLWEGNNLKQFVSVVKRNWR